MNSLIQLLNSLFPFSRRVSAKKRINHLDLSTGVSRVPAGSVNKHGINQPAADMEVLQNNIELEETETPVINAHREKTTSPFVEEQARIARRINQLLEHQEPSQKKDFSGSVAMLKKPFVLVWSFVLLLANLLALVLVFIYTSMRNVFMGVFTFLNSKLFTLRTPNLPDVPKVPKLEMGEPTYEAKAFRHSSGPSGPNFLSPVMLRRFYAKDMAFALFAFVKTGAGFVFSVVNKAFGALDNMVTFKSIFSFKPKMSMGKYSLGNGGSDNYGQPLRGRAKLWFMFKKLFFIGSAVTLLVSGLFFIWVATLEIPTLGNFAERAVTQSSKIYDKTGEVLLYDVFEDVKRTVVPLEDISTNMQLAILAIEDDKFYEHAGVRPLAILRSIINKIKSPTSRLASGSTITQQVIKNSLLTNDRKISRKIKEWVLAWRLEQQLSKKQILETYLNEIAFGGPLYGVEQASKGLFGKSASELTVTEAAYMAAIPKAPTFYLRNKDKLEDRKNTVLWRMYELGYLSQTEYTEAQKEEVEFLTKTDEGIKAPHFVFYVIGQLEEEYGENVLEKGGLVVRTSLDWALQEELEEIVKEQAERVEEQFNATNAGLVALDNETGQVIAMVGSKDYFAEDIDGKFNIATAFRQPGSTFKPFVYAKAIDMGYTPETILWDVKTEFSSACFPDGEPRLPQYADRCYNPGNFDLRFRGPISLRNALAQSLNIPAIKALYLTGISGALELAKSMGLEGLNKSPSFYGLNLVLGGGEVRLLDMVSAYSTFANEGVRQKPESILRVVSAEGELLQEYSKNTARVLEANTARVINDILSDNDAKRPMFGTFSSLYYEDREVAVKTGTTNNFRDTWTIGYDANVAVGVWVGNNDNTPMASKPSSTVVGPFWREAMDAALRRYSKKGTVFSQPDFEEVGTLKPVLRGAYQGSESYLVNIETGEVINPAEGLGFNPEEVEEVFVPNYHSILHWVNKSDPRGEVPENPTGETLYENFEYAVLNWVAESELPSAELIKAQLGLGTSSINFDFDFENQTIEQNTASPSDLPLSFVVTTPKSGQTLKSGDRVQVRLNITGPKKQIERIYYYVNSTYLGSGNYRETSTSFIPGHVKSIKNTGNTLRVIVQRVDGTRMTREVMFGVE